MLRILILLLATTRQMSRNGILVSELLVFERVILKSLIAQRE